MNNERFVLVVEKRDKFDELVDRIKKEGSPYYKIIDMENEIIVGLQSLRKIRSQKEALARVYDTIYDYLIANGYRCIFNELQEQYDDLQIIIDNFKFRSKESACLFYGNCLKCPFFTDEDIGKVFNYMLCDEDGVVDIDLKIKEYEEDEEINRGGYND